MPRLRVLRGRDTGKVFDLTRDAFLGREEGNDVKLSDETCSRRHARVQPLDERWVLYDLGSNNGAFVNGEKVSERLLKDGDQILVGKTLLLFEDAPEERKGVTVVIRDEPAALNVEKSLPTDARPSDEGLDPKAAYQRLKKLYDIAALLTTTLDPRLMTEGLAGLLLESLEADVVAIIRDGAEPTARARGASKGDLEISHALLERARQERKALMVSCAGADPVLAKRESVLQERISSMLCAPLLRGERWLGALYADLRRGRKSFTADELEFITAAARQASLALENAEKYTRAVAAAPSADLRLVGEDSVFRDAVLLAEKAAGADSTVLLLGESGTGKELFARLVHDRSRRRSGPFVAINCAALVETLLESELFGHEKGAFTGAVQSKPGKFELAHGGTVFLDEIGELPAGLQAKLLRVLQDRTFYRVGGTRPISIDARVVAATNRDLAKAVKEGKFREDLYYRLGVVAITIPPLRARKGDIPALSRHALDKLRARLKKPALALSPGVVADLAEYDWPGNVRELENVLERAAILADGAVIEKVLLPAKAEAPPGELPVNLEEMEKICLRRALEKTGGKKGEAAKLLGVSWPTLNKKLRDYGLETRPEPQEGETI